jgi:hypothetical protein
MLVVVTFASDIADGGWREPEGNTTVSRGVKPQTLSILPNMGLLSVASEYSINHKEISYPELQEISSDCDLSFDLY